MPGGTSEHPTCAGLKASPLPGGARVRVGGSQEPYLLRQPHRKHDKKSEATRIPSRESSFVALGLRCGAAGRLPKLRIARGGRRPCPARSTLAVLSQSWTEPCTDLLDTSNNTGRGHRQCNGQSATRPHASRVVPPCSATIPWRSGIRKNERSITCVSPNPPGRPRPQLWVGEYTPTPMVA